MRKRSNLDYNAPPSIIFLAFSNVVYNIARAYIYFRRTFGFFYRALLS